MTERLVWLVEDKEGVMSHNYSTGTRVYTRKHNACKLSIQYGNKYDSYAFEYQLVPTGNVYDKKGELISLEDLYIE
jgi:hypothetical protein